MIIDGESSRGCPSQRESDTALAPKHRPRDGILWWPVFALKLPAVPMHSPFSLPLQYTFLPPTSAFTKTSVQQAASAMEPTAQVAADSAINSYYSQLRALADEFPRFISKLHPYTFWLDRPDMEFSIIPWNTPMISTTPSNFAWALLYAREQGGYGAGSGTWLGDDAAEAFLSTSHIPIVQRDLPDRDGCICWIRVPFVSFVTFLMLFELEYMIINEPVSLWRDELHDELLGWSKMTDS